MEVSSSGPGTRVPFLVGYGLSLAHPPVAMASTDQFFLIAHWSHWTLCMTTNIFYVICVALQSVCDLQAYPPLTSCASWQRCETHQVNAEPQQSWRRCPATSSWPWQYSTPSWARSARWGCTMCSPPSSSAGRLATRPLCIWNTSRMLMCDLVFLSRNFRKQKKVFFCFFNFFFAFLFFPHQFLVLLQHESYWDCILNRFSHFFSLRFFTFLCPEFKCASVVSGFLSWYPDIQNVLCLCLGTPCQRFKRSFIDFSQITPFGFIP